MVLRTLIFVFVMRCVCSISPNTLFDPKHRFLPLVVLGCSTHAPLHMQQMLRKNWRYLVTLMYFLVAAAGQLYQIASECWYLILLGIGSALQCRLTNSLICRAACCSLLGRRACSWFFHSRCSRNIKCWRQLPPSRSMILAYNQLAHPLWSGSAAAQCVSIASHRHGVYREFAQVDCG